MSKKKPLYAIIALMVLMLCYVIGQTVVKPSRDKSGSEERSEQKVDVYFDFIQKADELKMEGYMETVDMPGGKTVGVVEDDVYGNWILLTPRTSIEAGVVLDNTSRKLSFDYMIHKNVADLSDGMRLQVDIIDVDTGEICYSQSLTVDSKEKECNIDLAEYKSKNVVVRLFSLEHTDDETGDWLVIQNAIIN